MVWDTRRIRCHQLQHGPPLPHTPRGRDPLPPVPNLAALSEDFVKRGDGTVMLHGSPMFVTHPLSSFGMSTYQKNKRAAQ